MKFIEGKILDRFFVEKNGGKMEIIFRYPKMADAKGAMKFVNNLVDEDALILMVKKIGLTSEKKWLKGVIEGIKKKQGLKIVIEVNGKYCGSATMNRGRYGSSHVGSIGISMSKEIRGLGIGAKLLNFLITLSKKELGIELAKIEYLKGNDAAKHLYEKLGFIEAGTIPKIRKRGRRYHDETFMYKVLK